MKSSSILRGSGTTLVVAKKLGRKFVGFELSKEYAKRGAERLTEVSRGDRLEGSPEPLVSAPTTRATTQKQRKAEGEKLKSGMNSEENELERSRLIQERAVIRAFEKTHAGWSIDRVVADPELKRRVHRGLPSGRSAGRCASWNKYLFGLRKSGKLSHIKATQRTELSF